LTGYSTRLNIFLILLKRFKSIRNLESSSHYNGYFNEIMGLIRNFPGVFMSLLTSFQFVQLKRSIQFDSE